MLLLVATAIVMAVAVGLWATRGDSPLAWGLPGATLFWAAGFAVTGFLIDRSRPDNPIGRLLAVAGFLEAMFELVLRTLGDTARTDMSLLMQALRQSLEWLWMPPLAALFTALALFPTGRLLGPRWRIAVGMPWVGVALATLGITLGPVADGETVPWSIHALADLMEALEVAGFVIFQVGAIVVLASVIVRFRNSAGELRVQMKWVAYAAAIVSVIALISELILTYLVPAGQEWWSWALSVAVGLIPVSIAVAVLRYRLYEIDLIVSRTVTYGLVIALSAVVYAGAVFLFGTILPVEGDLAVAASTLVVAAAFNPVRLRIQHWVDQKFNRGRFDAERVVLAFANRLQASLELGTVTGDLAGIVARTVQPELASVWIRADQRPSR